MNEQLQNELEEQARLLGMSAERECDLRGKVERLERELQAEHALADRLAECLSYHAEVDGEYAPDTTLAALAAWKEARNKI